MATVPYAAPYPRSAPQARPAPTIDNSLIRIALLCMIALFAIALLQLVLAGEATDAISSIANLEKEIEVLQAEVDALTAQMESLGSPRRIEEQAVRLGLKPFTVFEFAR